MSEQREMEEQMVVQIPLDVLRPSKTQPRKHFPQDEQDAMVETVKAQGVIEPLIVRPLWCVGWTGEDDTRPLKLDLSGYEIISGERRQRASKQAGMATAPCLVREIGDTDAMEIQGIENLQRLDLSPLEEAEGYARMLALPRSDATEDMKAAGTHLRYTVDLLCEKFGRKKTKIYDSLKLLGLSEPARQALSTGKLNARAAAELARIEDPEQQGKVLKQIVSPELKREPLTFVETRELVQTTLDDSIEAVEFKTWYEANHRPDENRVCLSRSETRKLFQYTSDLPPASPWVKTLAGPSPDLLKKGVDINKVPTWADLVKGSNITVTLIRKPDGKVLEVLDLKQAYEAATKVNKSPLFKDETKSEGGDKKPLTDEERKEKALKQQALVSNEIKVAARINDDVVNAAERMTVKQRRDFMEFVFNEGYCQPAWRERVMARRGHDSARKMEAAISAMDASALDGFMVDKACNHVPHIEEMEEMGDEPQIDEGLLRLAKIFGVSVKDIRKDLQTEAVKAENDNKAKLAEWEKKEKVFSQWLFEEYPHARNYSFAVWEATESDYAIEICTAFNRHYAALNSPKGKKEKIAAAVKEPVTKRPNTKPNLVSKPKAKLVAKAPVKPKAAKPAKAVKKGKK